MSSPRTFKKLSDVKKEKEARLQQEMKKNKPKEVARDFRDKELTIIRTFLRIK
jgi:hypothetical protein